MVITFVVECFDFFRSQVDENHIASSPKDRRLVFRQDGFRKLYPMFAIKKKAILPRAEYSRFHAFISTVWTTHICR